MTVARMRLASIILPVLDNDGKPLSETHAYLERELLSRFGGFTTSTVNGAWLGDDGTEYRDWSRKYEVAMYDTFGNRLMLEELAYALVIRARQEAIMVVMPDGTIDFFHAQNAVAYANDNEPRKEIA